MKQEVLFGLMLIDDAVDEKSREIDECLSKIALGDMKALDKLYVLCATDIYSFALSLMHNVHEAEDALQETFIVAAQAAGGYKSEKKPLAWLLTITKNICRQKMRKQKNIAEFALTEEWIADIAGDTEEKILVSQALGKLAAEEMQIVTLHAVSGFKHREISAMLEMPLATVLSKYHRALKKLKKILSQEG